MMSIGLTDRGQVRMDDSMVPTPEDLANPWPDVRHHHRPSRARRRLGMSTDHIAEESPRSVSLDARTRFVHRQMKRPKAPLLLKGDRPRHSQLNRDA